MDRSLCGTLYLPVAVSNKIVFSFAPLTSTGLTTNITVPAATRSYARDATCDQFAKSKHAAQHKPRRYSARSKPEADFSRLPFGGCKTTVEIVQQTLLLLRVWVQFSEFGIHRIISGALMWPSSGILCDRLLSARSRQDVWRNSPIGHQMFHRVPQCILRRCLACRGVDATKWWLRWRLSRSHFI